MRSQIGTVVVLAGLLITVTGASAQREGPLDVKRPPPRPPRVERPPEPEPAPAAAPAPRERPELRRRNDPAPKADANNPCPAGYIPKPASTEQPPRLTRTSGDPNTSQPASASTEALECVYSEVVVDRDGKVIERSGGPAADPLIEAARASVFTFSETLPDFLCTQVTSRYRGKSARGKWNLQDRISAELLYTEGKEHYQDFRRNGKEVRQHPRNSGSWSTGEFGTLMQDVFSPGTAAQFTAADDASAVSDAKVYSYTVDQKNSHWKIDYEGQVLFPAYKGSVWIDPESKRVLRIEMQAVDVPATYPMENIELMVEYGNVPIGEREYLLPLRSENQACKRYASACSKNVIEFRDYRKFTAESSISTVQSDVSFEGAKEEPEKKDP